MADIDRTHETGGDEEIPTGYVPEYGFRGFDQAQVHRNGTWYDDEGYDAYFLDRDGRLRPDKVPPFDGAYALGILAATQQALDMAAGLVGAGIWRNPDGSVRPFLRVRTENDLASENISCDYWDWRAYGTELSDIPVGEVEFDVSFGRLAFVDPQGSAALDDGRPLVVGQCDIWDEETGKALVDQSDFAAALGQLGEMMVAEATRESGEHGESISLVCLGLAGRLLGVDGIWGVTSPRQWAERGLIDDGWVKSLALWNDGVGSLRAEVQARNAARRARDIDDGADIPF